MQPLDRKPVKFHRKEDCHPPRGFINWWEDIRIECKKRSRQEAKRQIKNELLDYAR